MVNIHHGPLWKYEGRTGYAEYVETSAVDATLYVSGQAGYSSSGELPKGDMRAQLRNTFANITGLLDAADYPASQVIKIHIYVTDMDRALEAYDEVTGSLQQWGAAPASVMTEVGRLASVDMLCEIEAVAVR
nr:RidA family protein [Mycobacteroides chelonae]